MRADDAELCGARLPIGRSRLLVSLGTGCKLPKHKGFIRGQAAPERFDALSADAQRR
jgi:hypothetical protein